MANLPPLKLNRNVLAKIAGNNPEAIKQFENLFGAVETMAPDAANTALIAGNASANASAALALIDQLTRLVDLLASAPVPVIVQEPVLAPPTFVPVDRPSYFTQAESPLTGFTIAVTENWQDVWLLLTPAGALASGTITLPDANYAPDGREVMVSCTQAIAALTVTGPNATAVNGAPAALTANQSFRLKFNRAADAWFNVT